MFQVPISEFFSNVNRNFFELKECPQGTIPAELFEAGQSTKAKPAGGSCLFQSYLEPRFKTQFKHTDASKSLLAHGAADIWAGRFIDGMYVHTQVRVVITATVRLERLLVKSLS